MKCKKCGRKTDEKDTLCNSCKELLKQEKELDKLVVKNKQLNKLEITKEVETLNNFDDIKEESNLSIKEKLKDIVNIDEEDDIKEDKNNNMLVIMICVAVFIIFIIVFMFFLNKNKPEKLEEKPINYEKAINDYGDNVNLIVSQYFSEHDEIPSWSVVSDLVTYTEYDVVCNIRNIYKDATIYLDECSVDGRKIEYSYGTEQKEETGKKLSIYMNDDSIYNVVEDGSLVGSIICLTEDCEYVNAYDKYVLIKEENKYYIYNYQSSSMEFGPFNIEDSYENNMLVYDNKLYGILYKKDGIQNIYNINIEKTFKDINGDLLNSSPNLNSNLMYKYGYAVFQSDGKNNFVNLKTGNVSYTIDGFINLFTENNKNNLAYITVHNSLNTKITIYNSNGKQLFNGKEFNDIRFLNDTIIVSNDNNYYIYDTNLKLKSTSKEYNSILALYDDFIVVVDNEYLQIVDLEDNILATYDLKWNNSIYKFDNMLSGKVLENNEEIIYLVIEAINDSFKYYYNVTTKEFGEK